MEPDELSVSAERPDSPFQTSGVDHVTVWGSNAEAAVEFYHDLLGMPLVLRQPNLDDPSQTHLFFDAGDGRILTFFVGDRSSNRSPQPTQVGGVHHIALKVPPEQFEDAAEALQDDGRGYNLFDRGIFVSLYTRDNDGLMVELSTDRYSFPDELRGEVLAKAQEIREADDADYAEDHHLRKALEELDVDYTENELPDVSSGVGGL